MKRNRILYIALFLIASLLSCSSWDKKTSSTISFKNETLNNNESIIYIARNEWFYNSIYNYRIDVNGEKIGDLKMNAYFFKKLSPGNHTMDIYITKDTPEYRINFEIKPGKAMLLVITGKFYTKGFFDSNKLPTGLEKFKLDFGYRL